ncbi:hypothetical protein [Flavobacterium sp.]|uniref:hypothetical protein n=1 Tax=Flavobacterium sp. TaxID=239 RepID=UPI0039E6163D
MRKLTFLLFVGIIAVLTSCRKDFDTVPSKGGLQFSAQTVYLDTVFTGIGSSTYMLKVYNRSDDDISIPNIRLERGDASKYRIMVDGMTGIEGKGKYFPNVEILAKDSLFIFVEATIEVADTGSDFTYNDKILFDTGANQQSVDLVTLVQDVNLIIPDRQMPGKIKEMISINGQQTDIVGHTLTDDQLNWNNTKPYLVYGFAHVPPGKTLTIGAGTKVHFHDKAGLIIDVGAHIVIEGTNSVYDAEGNLVTDNEVTFEGDRLEPRFSETPGQWEQFLILSNSGNSINHLTLKNSLYGIRLPGVTDYHPQLTITNSQIYNSAFTGIWAINATVTGENLVVNYAGVSCFAGLEGGTYTMTHCTFNNDWQSTEQYAVMLDNYRVENNTKFPEILTPSFKNCIIYGSNRVEMLLDIYDVEDSFDQMAFQNCLIKFNDSGTLLADDPQYDFIRNPINNNKKNEDPKFANRYRNWLIIPEDSPAANAASTAFPTTPNADIFGIPRVGDPFTDMGAYNAYTP